MREAEFERKVTPYVVQGFDVIALKLNMTGHRGIYRLYLRDGGRVFVEFKSDTGRVTPKQEDLHHKLRSAGFDVCILRPKEGVARAAELIHRAFFEE